jgi:hypothetical protein
MGVVVNKPRAHHQTTGVKDSSGLTMRQMWLDGNNAVPSHGNISYKSRPTGAINNCSSTE